MSADNNIPQDQTNPEPLVADPSAEEFFFRNAQKRGQTLQEGDYGYELQQAAKARADGASITERLADTPDSATAPQEAVHPSLRVPDSPMGYEFPTVAQEHRQEAEQVGTWMRSAELPTSAGSFLIKAAAAVEPMTDAALSTATNALHRNLRQSWGKDYESTKDGLKAAIDRIDQKNGGKLWSWLDAHPEVMTSPTFVKSLASHLLSRKAR